MAPGTDPEVGIAHWDMLTVVCSFEVCVFTLRVVCLHNVCGVLFTMRVVCSSQHVWCVFSMREVCLHNTCYMSSQCVWRVVSVCVVCSSEYVWCVLHRNASPSSFSPLPRQIDRFPCPLVNSHFSILISIPRVNSHFSMLVSKFSFSKNQLVNGQFSVLGSKVTFSKNQLLN